MGASPDGQLVEDVGDCIAHRFFRDLELRSDAAVIQPVRQQIEYLALAARQLRQRCLLGRALALARQETLELADQLRKRRLAWGRDAVPGFQRNETSALERP